MNKPRKYNGVYKLPIKKHTKVRRPMSRWKITLRENDEIGIVLRGAYTPLVKDIYTGKESPLLFLENPLYCISIADQMIEKMNKAIKESEDRAWLGIPPKNLEMLQHYSKPSLLTRVKERFKR